MHCSNSKGSVEAVQNQTRRDGGAQDYVARRRDHGSKILSGTLRATQALCPALMGPDPLE
jgi:hypothetical protein